MKGKLPFKKKNKNKEGEKDKERFQARNILSVKRRGRQKRDPVRAGGKNTTSERVTMVGRL